MASRKHSFNITADCRAFRPVQLESVFAASEAPTRSRRRSDRAPSTPPAGALVPYTSSTSHTALEISVASEADAPPEHARTPLLTSQPPPVSGALPAPRKPRRCCRGAGHCLGAAWYYIPWLAALAAAAQLTGLLFFLNHGSAARAASQAVLDLLGPQGGSVAQHVVSLADAASTLTLYLAATAAALLLCLSLARMDQKLRQADMYGKGSRLCTYFTYQFVGWWAELLTALLLLWLLALAAAVLTWLAATASLEQLTTSALQAQPLLVASGGFNATTAPNQLAVDQVLASLNLTSDAAANQQALATLAATTKAAPAAMQVAAAVALATLQNSTTQATSLLGQEQALLGTSTAMCPSQTCLMLGTTSFLRGGACICDMATITSLHTQAHTASQALLWVLLGLGLMGLGCVVAMLRLAAEVVATSRDRQLFYHARYHWYRSCMKGYYRSPGRPPAAAEPAAPPAEQAASDMERGLAKKAELGLVGGGMLVQSLREKYGVVGGAGYCMTPVRRRGNEDELIGVGGVAGSPTRAQQRSGAAAFDLTNSV